jgi:hypothetical protein
MSGVAMEFNVATVMLYLQKYETVTNELLEWGTSEFSVLFSLFTCCLQLKYPCGECPFLRKAVIFRAQVERTR